MKKKSSFKFFKFFVLSLSLFTAISCSNTTEAKPYLTTNQIATLNSIRSIPNTKNEAYEINYTADYKVNEFIDQITKNRISKSSDCKMIMKKLIADSSAVVPLKRLTNSTPGCSSLICKLDNGKPVIGRNYDLDINSNGAVFVIHTAPKNGYKSVGVADGAQCGLSFKDVIVNNMNKELALYLPYYTMDGVNEKGFACSIMVLSEGGCVQDTGKKWLPSTLVVRYLLDNAESVDNAIELLKNVDFRNDYFVDLPDVSLLSFHWALTDKTGNKAVIEYVNGEMVVNKFPLDIQYNETDDSMILNYPKEEKGFLLSTNFFVSEGFTNTKHDSGRWRYQTLKEKASANSTPTKDELREMMKSVKYLKNDKDYIWELKQQGKDPENVKDWDWITIWTDILNTDDLTLSLWVKEDFEIENDFSINFK